MTVSATPVYVHKQVNEKSINYIGMSQGLKSEVQKW